MARASESARSRGRSWWIPAIATIAVVALVGLAIVAVALRQIRVAEPEVRALEWRSSSTRVRLEIVSAVLVVVPAPAGEPFRVTADYDPSSYTLERDADRVRFGPTHSTAMALLRIKLGQRPPSIRVTLPLDLDLDLDADLRGTYAAIELGGLRLNAVDVVVAGGAATVSFLEPTATPLERFTMHGDKGSVEVTGLGQASPRSVVIDQRLGELDLDLRGPWTRDAEIRLGVRLAGGGVWLPEDVVILGLDDRIGPWPAEVDDGRPRLHIDAAEGSGRLVFVH